MWIIRFLSGPLAGQIVPLSKHSTLIGRAPNCDIKIPSGSVSKEHIKVEVFDDKLIITDVGSRNGTFLNGVKIRTAKAKTGDKLAIHDIFLEVQRVPDSWAARFQQPLHIYGNPAPQYNAYGAAAPQYQGVPEGSPLDMEMPEDGAVADLMNGRLPGWAAPLQGYMERVAMPGVYRLAEMFEFRWVMAGFMAVFILLVTALSTVPLMRILKVSIEEESQQHALTIATTLARVNRPFLVSGQETGASIEIATSRPGVTKAFIISNVDGNVIAPATQAGTFPNLPFIHEGRRDNKESVRQIDDNTVVALVPITAYNQDTGAQTITHWAVVFYDMSALAVDDGQVLSLFITTLFIALLLGGLLFYFLYKLVEYPIRSINKQLDIALKEGQDSITVTYQFPALQLLASNISSALNRLISGNDVANARGGALEHDRNREAQNLVELIGFAAMAIRAHDLSIAAVNQAFEQRLGANAAAVTTMSVNELSDQALKLSIKDLIERVDQNPDDMATNELEFSGLNYNVVAQAIFGTNKVSYYLVVLLPRAEGE